MTRSDPNDLDMLELTTAAMMFRLNQADPASPESITISRDVFDKLLVIADFARRASRPNPFGQSLQATMTGGSFSVVIDGGQFGQFKGEGRNLLEAIINAHRAYGSKLASFVD